MEEGSFVSARHGETIHTYAWRPSGTPKCVVFLEHGIHSTAFHEFLAPTTDAAAHFQPPSLPGSAVEALLEAGCAVLAHDHRGHGKSAGLPAFFSVDDLVDDALQYVREEKAKLGEGMPLMLCGVSMGALVAILMGMRAPELFAGAVLVSPAVKEPDDSFGPFGQVLKAVSAVLGILVPRMEVLKLPSAPIDNVRDYWDNDPEVWHGKLRVRPGRTMVEAYRHVGSNAKDFKLPVLIMCGTTDTLVSPEGMTTFAELIGSEDKKIEVFDGMWHVLFIEEGREKVLQTAVSWIKERV